MKKAEHILTFIKRLKIFTQREGITSILKVDGNNVVEDVFDTAQTTGGIICDIDNGIGELVDTLMLYYEKTNNKRLLRKLQSIEQIK